MTHLSTQSFYFDELADQFKSTALGNAITLSMLSCEWKHVISTASIITTGLLETLKGYEADSPLTTVTAILSTDTLEALKPFKDIDMPASTRLAVNKLCLLASNHATVAQASEALQNNLENEIVEYWGKVFRSHSHVIEWLETVDMTFTQNGEVVNYDKD